MANKLRKESLAPFTGITFEIRRVKLGDYLRELKDLPFSLAPGTLEELDKIKDSIERLPAEKQADVNDKTLALFLTKGVTRMKYPGEDWRKPNIWFGAEHDCPEDFVVVADLGTDADLIAGEIAQLSFDLQGVKALQGFFRDAQQQPAGPSGQEVRPEAVEPTG